MSFLTTAAALLCAVGPQTGPQSHGRDGLEPATFSAPIRLTSEGEPLGIEQLTRSGCPRCAS